ncbi:MAG: replication-associated recombination protein A [Bacteroidales bacterium]|nr:replication-associated recombination protein A [Bacteroidales bacterium]
MLNKGYREDESLSSAYIPLAERLRPRTLDDYVGQEHLVGKDSVLRKMLESGDVKSFILWGPPGVGKTTIAKIMANTLHREFYTLSAVSSGVKDVRDVIDKAKNNRMFAVEGAPILFIDEIHRFNKAQQDALLGAVEEGTVVLIGATTENPSFEVITPLLSRCQVYVLKPLEHSDLDILLNRALKEDIILKSRNITVKEKEALFSFCNGDARKLLNILELVSSTNPDDPLVIDDELVKSSLQQNIALYDKNGEQHYDIISAFIKSMRGSDPNGAIYWMARMLAGGEDPLFIARRMVILAAEDVGLANPNALLLANACFDTVHKVGMPEARIPLAETCIYLATSPKSNSAYMAIDSALATVNSTSDAPPVPLHLRNAPTRLMKDLGYHKDYKYAHSYEGNFVDQEFLPDALKATKFYDPGNNKREDEIRAKLAALWKKYNY